PHAKDMPMLEFFLPAPTLVQVRFHQWNDILASPTPDAQLTITRALWHFARGLAFAGQDNIKDATSELDAFQKIHDAMPNDLTYGSRNLAKKVLVIPGSMLKARLNVAQKDFKTAIAHLQAAIDMEDGLNYIEPADWPIPVRETLGALHLRNGNPALAEK